MVYLNWIAEHPFMTLVLGVIFTNVFLHLCDLPVELVRAWRSGSK